MEKFAFIIHPMDLKRDAARKIPILKYLPLPLVEKLALKISPKIMSHITGVESATGARAEGWLIGCPLSPRQLAETVPEEVVYEHIVNAGKLAASLGAKVVGLGAFTAVRGDKGITIAKRLEGIINVTTGNSYTVYTGIEGLLHAAELMEVDIPHARAAIIGATGSIGAVCAKILARQVADIVLVGRDIPRLEALRDEMSQGANGHQPSATVWVTDDVRTALQDADLILAVSSSTGAIIFPQDLKSGAVVCDVARPRDVSKQVVEQRDDVLVIEGGVIEVPGDVNFNFNFGFPDKTAYACMSETMLMALEGTYEPYTLGRDLTMEQVQHIGEIAKKHGFKLAGFRSFEKAVDEATIEQVRRNAQRNRTTRSNSKVAVSAN